jgi:chromosome segregation ATPase
MTSLMDVTARIAALVEANRALQRDLEAQRRAVAEIEDERDALLDELDRLHGETRELPAKQAAEESAREAKALRGRLLQEAYKAEDLRRERDMLVRDTDATQARLQLAEQRAAALELKLEEVERDRDGILAQLDHATAAMHDIRTHLEASMDGVAMEA